MNVLASEVGELFSQYLQQPAHVDLAPLLKQYELAEAKYRYESFASTFYPTLYAPFCPVVAIAPGTCLKEVALYSAQQNLGLQNTLRIARPRSFYQRLKSASAAQKTRGTAPSVPLISADYLLAGDFATERPQGAALPCTLKPLRTGQPACAFMREHDTAASDQIENMCRTTYRYTEIIKQTVLIQTTARRRSAYQAYYRTLCAAKCIQGFARARTLNRGFKQHFRQLIQYIIARQRAQKQVFAQLSTNYRTHIQRCAAFTRDVFGVAPVRAYFFFPFELNDPAYIFWQTQFEKAIIEALDIDREHPKMAKISDVQHLKLSVQKNLLLDLIVILSQPPDKYLQAYRNSQITATLSVFSLLTSEIVSSLVIIGQNDCKVDYSVGLFQIKKPFLLINAREGLDGDSFDLSTIDTLQLFNLNVHAQRKLTMFENGLFIERKKCSGKCVYVRAAMLTSPHYCYQLENYQVQCNKFSVLARAPVLFAYEAERLSRQQIELLAMMSQESKYYKEAQSTTNIYANAVLVSNTAFPDICDISHSGFKNYFVDVQNASLQAVEPQRTRSSYRILTVSGLRSRLSSKRVARQDYDSQDGIEIKIEVHDGSMIDERAFEDRAANVQDDAVVQLTPFLPIKYEDIFSAAQAENIYSYIMRELERYNCSAPRLTDYRLLNLNASLLRYKVMQQTVTSKANETMIKGRAATGILDFTNVDAFYQAEPDTREQVVSEQIEKKVEERLAFTAHLVVFVDTTQSEALVSYILSAEDVCERKKNLPYRSHGWIFPAREVFYAKLKKSAVKIINYLVAQQINGYATISFVVGPLIEPYYVTFGLNQLILQFFAVYRLAGQRFDSGAGVFCYKCGIFEAATAPSDVSAISLDLCHELLRRVDKRQLRALLYRYSFDVERKEGFLYDIADDIFVILVSREPMNKKLERMRSLVVAILALIHAYFSDASTSILSGASRKREGSRDVEMSSNMLGVFRALDDMALV